MGIDKKKIAVLLTTFNRKQMTENCIMSLVYGNENVDFRFVIADDGSTDGTVDILEKLSENVKIHIIPGDGNLYWNGGMCVAMGYALEHISSNLSAFDYALMVNDDVTFEKGAIDKLINRLEVAKADIIVGATKDVNGKMSYGCVKKESERFARFSLLEPSKEIKQADTFNCNCVLIKSDVFLEIGMLDNKYRHSMGDYDYGMMARRKGFIIINSEDYVGACSDNDIKGTWRDINLSRIERIKKKESPKGLPFSDWFHFVNKNYGLLAAVYHSATPYLRILLNK